MLSSKFENLELTKETVQAIKQLLNDDKITLDTKKKLSLGRRQQLKNILDELTEFADIKSKSTTSDRNILSDLSDEKIQSKIQALYELKELEKMVNAQLVLNAKETYLKKQQQQQNPGKVTFVGPNDIYLSPTDKPDHRVSQQYGKDSRLERNDTKSNEGYQFRISHTDATHQLLSANVERPPSTYGLRKTSKNLIPSNDDTFFPSTETDTCRPLNTTNIEALTESKCNIIERQNQRDNIPEKHYNKFSTSSSEKGKQQQRNNDNNNRNKYNGTKMSEIERKDADVNPVEISSDILSLEGESLHGLSFDSQDEVGLISSGRRNVLVRHSKEMQKKKMRVDITRHKRSTTKDFFNNVDDIEEREEASSTIRMESSASKLAKEEKKSISVQLTLRFEGMAQVCDQIKRRRRCNNNNNSRSKSGGVGTTNLGCGRCFDEGSGKRMIKVSQQISRGASSFVVFADDVMPGSEFKFFVYRRNNHPFSLCLFIDNIRDVRISTCCEQKHQPGVRLGHFRIIDVRPFIDPSTGHPFRCEACIKGVSWNEWVKRSKRVGKFHKNRNKSLSPLPSPVKGTPSLESLSSSRGRQKKGEIQSSLSSSASSIPSISEMDYKEELDEYNREHEDEEEVF